MGAGTLDLAVVAKTGGEVTGSGLGDMSFLCVTKVLLRWAHRKKEKIRRTGGGRCRETFISGHFVLLLPPPLLSSLSALSWLEPTKEKGRRRMNTRTR